MRWLSIFFRFYIESSIHVALSVLALIWITFLKLDIPLDISVSIFAFSGTIVGYNFIKYDELVRVRKVKLSFMFKTIIGFSFIFFLVTFYYFLQLQTITKLFGFIGLLITILYTLPLFPHKTNMRNWAGIKIFLVALVWVMVTVWLPVLNYEYDFNVLVILKSIQRFILVFILMLIFEIVDLLNDAPYLRTIPQQLGEKKTKYLSYGLSVLFLLFDFLKPNITLNEIIADTVLILILGAFTYFASRKKKHLYTTFWAEAIPIFWLILLLLFE